MKAHFISAKRVLSLLLFATAAGVASQAKAADDVAAFYAGKTITMIIGFPPGGGNDVYGRIVAQYIGKYIPGSPRVIMQSMPGAGSIVAANYIYNSAPRDGTILGAVAQEIALEAKLGADQAKYQASKFDWIGRLAPTTYVTMVWNTSKIMTIADAERTESTQGATGAGSAISLYPNVMNELLKTKFKIVMGYQGSAQAMLAMERGEVEGHSTSWEVVQALHPDWVEQGKIRFLVQHGLSRNPELPNIPTSVELAANDQDRAVMRVVMSTTEVGRSYFTTPGVPADRLTALRRAFDQTMKDPEFVAAIKAIHGDVGLMKGQDLQNMIGELDSVPKPVLDQVKAVYKDQ